VRRGGLGGAYSVADPFVGRCLTSELLHGKSSLEAPPCFRFHTPLIGRVAKSLSDSLHQRLQQFRCLHRCSDCYRVERTSSRAGLTPAVDHDLFTAHPVTGTYN